MTRDQLAIQRRWCAELSATEQWAGVAIIQALEKLAGKRRQVVVELACAWLDLGVPPPRRRKNADRRQLEMFGGEKC